MLFLPPASPATGTDLQSDTVSDESAPENQSAAPVIPARGWRLLGPMLLVPVFAVFLSLVCMAEHGYRVAAGPTWKSTRTGKITTYTPEGIGRAGIWGAIIGGGLGFFILINGLRRQARTLRPMQSPTSQPIPDPELRKELLAGQPVEAWIEQLSAGDVAARCAAALALGEIGAQAQYIMDALVQALLDEDKAVHVCIGIAIGITKVPSHVRRSLLHDLLQPDAQLAKHAVQRLRAAHGGRLG